MIQNDRRSQGVFLALFAFISWGFFPLFFDLFSKEISVYEILLQRIIWSVFFMAIAMFFLKKFSSVINLLKRKQSRNALLLSGFLISVNWGTFIYAVNNGKVLETGLGYFINPIVNIALGFLLFSERLSPAQRLATFIATVAIGVQIWHLGELPAVALALPISFALYGAVRKRANVPALEGLFVETLLLLPFAIFYLFYLQAHGQNHFDLGANGALMAVSGIVTILPLLAFNAATVRIGLTAIGILQYASPTISVLCGVFVFKEQMDFYKILSFSLIWLGIFLIAREQISKRKPENAKF